MKTRSLLLFLTGILLFGCSEDKGNYNYTPIDDITVEGIDNLYSRNPGDKLEISVMLKHSIDTPDSSFEYLWEIDDHTVAETKDLDIVVENISYGRKECRYTIINPENGMKYFWRFTLDVVSTFNWGYYFLTEKSDGSTELAYLQAVSSEDEEAEIPEFQYVTSLGEYKFGDDPKEIIGTFGYITVLEDYYWTIYIVTKNGEYPMMQTENATFSPGTLINASNFIDKGKGYVFNPDQLLMNSGGNKCFLCDGKIITYNSGLLYRPAEHDKEYKWDHLVEWESYSHVLGFDGLTKKFFSIFPTEDDPEKGIVGDSYSYDAVIEVTFPEVDPAPSFQGHFILGETTSIVQLEDDEYYETAIIVSGDSNGLYMTELNMTRGQGSKAINPTPRTTFANVKGFDEYSQAIFANKDWYISAGNKIYTSPELLPVFTEMAVMPSELGSITAIQPTTLATTLVVATYNEASSEERKGSVVFIDFQSGEITIHRNVINKCTSFLCANTNAFWGETGDNK